MASLVLAVSVQKTMTCCVLSKERSAVRRRSLWAGSSCLWMVSVHGGAHREMRNAFEQEKGVRWMPWHQEAMKDVARCEKPRGAASRL